MPKWLKYALLVLGPVVLVAALLWTSTRGGPKVPTWYTFVDITTGEVLRKHKDDFASIPIKNAEGKRVIFPAIKQDDGSYVLNDRYRDSLDWLLRDKIVTKEQLKIDVETLKVLPN